MPASAGGFWQTTAPARFLGEVMSRRLILKRICGACPEAYDVYDGDTHVGCMRLRHGSFRVTTTDRDEVIYRSNPVGDGIFADDEERVRELNSGCRAILERIETPNGGSEPPIYDIHEDWS